MNTQELFELGSKKVVEINKLMSGIEEVDKRMSNCSSDTIIALQGVNGTIRVDDILPTEVIVSLTESVMNAINTVRSKREFELERLLGLAKPAMVNPVSEGAVQDTIKPEATKEPEVIIPERVKDAEPPIKGRGYKTKLTVGEVQSLIDEGNTILQIAEHFGYKSAQTVYMFMSKNNITLPTSRPVKEKKIASPKTTPPKEKVELKATTTYRTLTKDDIPRIKELYTNGITSLSDTAKDLGVEVGKLYKFIAEKGLGKAKKNDPYIDSNRMSKEKFRSSMLKGQG